MIDWEQSEKYHWVSCDAFNAQLTELACERYSVRSLLEVEGVWELVAEELGDDALAALEGAREERKTWR